MWTPNHPWKSLWLPLIPFSLQYWFWRFSMFATTCTSTVIFYLAMFLFNLLFYGFVLIHIFSLKELKSSAWTISSKLKTLKGTQEHCSLCTKQARKNKNMRHNMSERKLENEWGCKYHSNVGMTSTNQRLQQKHVCRKKHNLILWSKLDRFLEENGRDNVTILWKITKNTSLILKGSFYSQP